MKIAMLGHKRVPSSEGGVEKAVEEYAARLAGRGHDVLVYNRGGHNVFGREYDRVIPENYRGFRILTIPGFLLGSIVPVYSLLAAMHAAFIENCDAILFFASGPCAAIRAVPKSKAARVAFLRGIDSRREKWGRFAKWYLRFGERTAAICADRTLVVSEPLREYLLKTYGAESTVIPNGAEENGFIQEEQTDRETVPDGKPKTILFLGRLVPEKGVHLLIKAYVYLKERGLLEDWELVIAGAAPKRSRYAEILNTLSGGRKDIRFTGYIERKNTALLFRGAEIFVLPSSVEGMSNALLEAMSYGKCCLLSDIPENRQTAGDAAAYFENGKAGDLAAALLKLVRDPQRRMKLGNEAKALAAARFRWEESAKMLEQILVTYRQETGDAENEKNRSF